MSDGLGPDSTALTHVSGHVFESDDTTAAERLLGLPVHLYFEGKWRAQYVKLANRLMLDYGVSEERRSVYGVYIEAIALATIYARRRMDPQEGGGFAPKELADVLGTIRKLGEQIQKHTEATFVRIGTEDLLSVVTTILQIVEDEVSDPLSKKRIFGRVRTFIKGKGG